jgi:DnaJ-class molecular chaperone
MEALLPSLVQTARSLAMQSNPAGANMSEAETRELDEYLTRTTQSLFSGGSDNPMSGLLASLAGGMGSAGAGGANPMELMSSLMGGGNNQSSSVQKHKGDIHETIEVDLIDFFGNKEFCVKYHARQFDPALGMAKKKKRRVTVVLPAGAPEDHVVAAAEMGNYDSVTNTHGTLYIHFKCKKDTYFSNMFRRNANKLTLSIPMESFKHDALSFERTFAHPMGKLFRVTVDPRILEQGALGLGGREFITIPGFGMPRFGSTPAGPLQMRVFMDVEKMVHEAGDIVLQDRHCIAQAMHVSGEAFGFDEVRMNITNSSWVHTRADNLPVMGAAAAGGAVTRVPVVVQPSVSLDEDEEASDEDANELDEVGQIDEIDE